MTARLGFSSNFKAICRSCLLSKRRTPARESLAIPNGSGAATHFLCPTLSAKVGLLALVSAAGGSATAVPVSAGVASVEDSVDFSSGVRLRDMMILHVDVRGISLIPINHFSTTQFVAQ